MLVVQGGYTNRTMKRGSNILNYQLYDNSTGQVWGNGTGGTVTVTDSYGLLIIGSVTKNYTNSCSNSNSTFSSSRE